MSGRSPRPPGVGVGTVYRRFGDKASVIAALIGDQERQLQDDLPVRACAARSRGAGGERLDAFLRALCALTERNLDLLHASERAAAGGRHSIGAYRAWHQHTAILLAALDPSLDAAWHADLLLAPVGAALYRHHRRDVGLSPSDIADRVTAAARRLIDASLAQPRQPDRPSSRSAGATS
jgi:AcrR family transcriptional regulator